MATTEDFNIRGNLNAFMDDLLKKDDKPKHPPLVYRCDELLCYVYVNATKAILSVLGEKEEVLYHLNDNAQFHDFPGFVQSLECREELSEMAGFEVTEETLLWKVAKAITGDLPWHGTDRAKYRPNYH